MAGAADREGNGRVSKKGKKARGIMPPVVSYRIVAICFAERTVSIDGRTIGPVQADCLEFPILSGDAVFMPSRNVERIA
jgi:hypothetical protein